MQARPSRLTPHHCVAMLGVFEGRGHPAKPLRETSIFIPPLSCSAGMWRPFNSGLIILDRMFQSQGRAGEDKAVAPGTAQPLNFGPDNVVSVHTEG